MSSRRACLSSVCWASLQSWQQEAAVTQCGGFWLCPGLSQSRLRFTHVALLASHPPEQEQPRRRVPWFSCLGPQGLASQTLKSSVNLLRNLQGILCSFREGEPFRTDLCQGELNADVLGSKWEAHERQDKWGPERAILHLTVADSWKMAEVQTWRATVSWGGRICKPGAQSSRGGGHGRVGFHI